MATQQYTTMTTMDAMDAMDAKTELTHILSATSAMTEQTTTVTPIIAETETTASIMSGGPCSTKYMSTQQFTPYDSKCEFRQMRYLKEPSTADSFSDAKRVKCIVWNYTLSEDGSTAFVKYGACIYKNDQYRIESSGEKKSDSYIRRILNKTANDRFALYPVTFIVSFANIKKFRPVIKNVLHTNKSGEDIIKPKIEMEEYFVSKQDQVFKAIRQRMCDKVHGGCSSRSRIYHSGAPNGSRSKCSTKKSNDSDDGYESD